MATVFILTPNVLGRQLALHIGSLRDAGILPGSRVIKSNTQRQQHPFEMITLLSVASVF